MEMNLVAPSPSRTISLANSDEKAVRLSLNSINSADSVSEISNPSVEAAPFARMVRVSLVLVSLFVVERGVFFGFYV